MIENKKSYTTISYVIAITACTAMYLIIGHFFNFYYDLNDDVLIKDILSGKYTGSPDAHSIQMLYPISWLLKALYSINPERPWMGILEIGLMWLSHVIIIARTQMVIAGRVESRVKRGFLYAGIYAGGVVFALGTELWEITMLQYTVVCGMLATAAAYIVLTRERFYLNENIVPIILVVLAFNIRTEMLLLMSPFLAVVGIRKWMEDGFDWETNRQYLSFVGLIILGLALSLGINSLAYKDADWKDFNKIFSARTEIYDFTGIPSYEENQAFYDSQGATQTEYDRMMDYNYVLSDRVDSQFLEAMANYANENAPKKNVSLALFEVIKAMSQWVNPAKMDQVTDYSIQFSEDGVKLHVPWNTIVVLLYVLVVIAAIIAKEIRWAYTLPILLVMRNICWGYVAYRGRINARIAHPMYFMECMILIGILAVAWSESTSMSETRSKAVSWTLLIGATTILIIIACYIPANIKEVEQKAAVREEVNKKAEVLYNYTSENARTYYMIDVYSTVGFTERVFDIKDYGKGNTQLAGGWAALSPLDTEKQNHYKNQDEWLFITANKIDFMTPTDIIGEGEDVDFYVYEVNDVR